MGSGRNVGDGCRRRHRGSPVAERVRAAKARTRPQSRWTATIRRRRRLTLSNRSCWSPCAIRHRKAIGQVLALLAGGSPPYGVRDAAAVRRPSGRTPYGQAIRAPPVLLPPSGSHATPTDKPSVGFVVCGPRSGSRLRTRRTGPSLPGAVDRRISGWFAFPVVPLAATSWVLFGSESAACGRVDALVAVVPADPVARRGIASQNFLNHTRARSATGRLGLGYDALADFKGHAHSRLLVLVEDSRRQSSATVTGRSTARA